MLGRLHRFEDYLSYQQMWDPGEFDVINFPAGY
jgi:hypothetical protein